MKRLGTLVLLVAFAAQAAANAPVFTIDSVLAALRTTYPQASRVTDELPPGVIAREDLVYARRGRMELGLDLYRPAGSRKLPAVLVIHGGGWIAGDRSMERPFAKHLAALGYVAVPVSYRLGKAGRFPAPVYDLKEAVRWLRAHAVEYGIDAAHIAAVGGSAGATLATMLGASNGLSEFEGDGGSAGWSSDVQAVVNIDGTVTFLDNRLIESSEKRPSPYWEYVHGPYGTARATWVAASPILLVSPKSAPTLFIESGAPEPVLSGREEMCQRLRILGIDARVIRLAPAPHTFWLVHPWFDRIVAETNMFLREHLKSGRSN